MTGSPPPDEVGRLVVRLRAAGGTEAVCQHCRASIGTPTGVGLTMFAGPEGWFLASHAGELADEVEDLQISLAQGPGVEAARTLRPVLVGDLTAASAAGRWPDFAPRARDQGVAAVFAFPVLSADHPVAVLDLCRAEPGPLSDDDQGTASRYAAATALLLLDDLLRAEPQSGAELPVEAARTQQAVGMVIAQIHADAPAAMRRLRGHAEDRRQSLSEVVEDVLSGRLRFERGLDR
ncbi:GAF and ANTAR domain-containing protein [Actinoplanes awajinensis]|uniref:Uncharacterized protein n=1 Tax=Actinoplanes awajinensis subsp. mycoplanecinus TaxID=135947 RepID=A0A101JT85_9ACTN|nr:GAF and ANTAR domain-containing protein [Actinoplanes awajinensis]KUL32610.1 hypothetical protein ADL15_18995 [Actinoplanes awajinensis subsp. mycoplanecinus]